MEIIEKIPVSKKEEPEPKKEEVVSKIPRVSLADRLGKSKSIK